MASNYLSGGVRLSVTLAAARSSGDLEKAAKTTGIIMKDGAIGDVVEMQIEGEWSVPKATGAGSAGTKGTIAYVTDDAGTYKVTGDATGNDPCGMFTADVADGGTTATVKLAGGPWGL